MRLFSLLRIKPGSRHFNNNLINFKPSQSNFTKCAIALKLSWPHVIGVDWPVLQSHVYVDHLLWPMAFLPFGYDYDKSEVKENVFHCLWWQETKLFAQMSLSNYGMTLVPPSSYLYHHQRQTKPGPILLVLKPPFLSPLQPFSISRLVILWSWLWECWEGLEILSSPPHKGTVICSVIRHPFPLPQAVSLSLSNWTPCILDNPLKLLWCSHYPPVNSIQISTALTGFTQVRVVRSLSSGKPSG